tara:strand:+ start:208 stop:486 length:279 start_codon:yes stop_codon:yes gene_type:complete
MGKNKQMKTYINNSRFMEFIDEMATQITEMNFGEETFEEGLIYIDSNDKSHYETHLTNEAQEFYNEMYSEYEMMANDIMGVYSDNELITIKN